MTAHRSRTRLLKRALLGSTALLPALALLSWGEARAQAVNIGQANGNLIIPDGRTATHLSGNGRTTDITTSTMSGGNAYNSFSQFKAGAGNTVNLHVPNTARNLVNIVRDGPVDIQGTLNSYKNGQIGGNVVFSDSYGFVVGPSGSVNVGSLSVVTPTRDFNERLLGANGQVDQALAARLLAGNVPISPDGRVSIAGRINARRAVQITAYDVVVAGSLDAAAREAQRKAQFEATVNTSGLVEGGAIVVRNGRIAIVASNDARIGGRLEAGGTAQRGGAISIQAGREVTLAASAQVSAHATHPVRTRAGATRKSGTQQPDTPFMPAAGPSVSITAGSAVNLAGAVAVTAARDGIIGRIDVTSAGNIALAASANLAAPGAGKTDGGRIIVKADKDLTVADGARVRASAADTGNGGFVELSGLDTARIGAADLDLTARAGKAGTLLIDPNNLIIGGTSQGGTGDAVTIDASFSPSLITNGANVILQANQSITIAGGGLIDTRKLDATKTYSVDNSGSVFLSAPTITVEQGGQILADAIAGPTLYSGGLVALQSPSSGKITIAGTVRGGAVLLDAVTPGTLTASASSNPVTIAATGIIDTTRAADGPKDGVVTGIADLKPSSGPLPGAGGVTINGSVIDLAAGSLVQGARQSGLGTPKGGDITIAATALESRAFGKAEVAATVNLQGKLTTGGKITVSTDASAISSLIDSFFDDPKNAITVGALTEAGAGFLLGLQGGYNGAKSTSTITVGGLVGGTGDVSFVAKGLQTAADLGITFTIAHPIAASAWYGAIDATTAVTIAKTAQVSGANITAQASNTATLGVSAMAVSPTGTPALAAIAVGRADIATSATVATGATLTTTGNLSVIADNTNSFSTSAAALGFGNGLFGVGIAVSNTNASATASLGASVGTGQKVGDVTVQAISDTLLNKTSGTASVGDPFPIAKLRSLVPDQLAADGIGTIVGKFVGDTPLKALAPAQSLKGTLGLSYGRSSQSAQATIGSDAGTPSVSAPAPVINADGNVSVISRLYDAPIRSTAGAANTSSSEPESNAPQATGAANVALAVGVVDHTSNAVIGPDTTVDANNVAVSAKTDVPFGIAWDKDKLATPGSIFSAILNTANGNGGVINNVMTSASTATTDAAEFGIAASINILGIDNSTTAWIANGARITTRDTSGATWGPALVHNDVFKDFDALAFKSGLDVNAGTVTQTINLAGSPSWFIVIAGNGATTTTGQNGTPTKGSDGASAGGSVNINMFESKTVAGIGDGVTVNAATDVNVNAWAHDQAVTLVPSSGSGAAFGVTGLISALTIDNVTHASISRTAQLTAQAVDVEATQDNRIITLSGALTRSTGTSVGLSAVWANIAQDTKASVGDNADDVKDAGFGTSLAALPASGSIATSALNVQAATSGTVFALSVAASVAAPNDPNGMVGQLTGKFKDSVINPGLDKTSTKLIGGLSMLSKFSQAAADKLTGAVKDGFAKVSETVNETTAADTRKFSITATGSLTGVTTQIDTVALLDRANVVRLGQQAGPAVTVQAFNTSITSATSGAASATLAGAQPAKLSAAVSGALALMVATDETHASVAGSNLGDTGDVAVQALAGGQKLALGIGLAVDTNATSPSLSFAGSLSAGFVSDSVTATVTDSVLRGAGNGRVTVSAYQSTDMALGGVAIGVSAKGVGVGTAVTIGVVQDLSDDEAAVGASVRDTAVTGYTDMTVEASSVARILAAAGVAAVAPGSLALSGSFVFNTISPTVLAEVVGTGTTAPAVQTSNTLSVIASSDRDGHLQSLLNDRAGLAYRGINTGLDFATQPLGYTGDGAAILGLAGVVSGSGQASLGASLVVAVNNARHTAQLSGVDASADSIAVAASDGTTIANFAGGLAASSGALAGVAAITANTVLNATSATIGGADAAGQGTKITARNLTVSAGSQTTLLAGAASIGVSQEFAGGLGIASNVIKANVAAAIAGGTVNASGDAIVRATSAGDATTTASGIAGAGVGAFAGSLVNTIELTKVDAAVTGGADLKAAGSVAVLAGNSDTSRSLSGTLAVAANADVTVAVGMSIVNSVIKNDTTARIDGGATVDAAGGGAGITGNSGDLASSISLVSLLPGVNLVPGALEESQTTRHGLIVNAMSGQSSVNYAISGAFAANVNPDTLFISGAGALLPVNNTIAGSTSARIENAAINTRLTGGGRPDVTVLATDHSLASNAALAVSASTTVAVSGGLANNLMLRTTDAHVSGSRIGAANAAAGAVTVRAAATQQAASFVVGGAATIGAAAGSLTTNVFGSKTTASLSNTAVTAASTAVNADSANGFYGLTGAFAAGAISVAGGLNLIVDLNETTATVTGGSLALSGDLDVQARSKEDIRPFAVGGALSGGLSVAGMANLLVDIATTRAGLYGTTVNAADVTVDAAQAITMMPVTGAISVAFNPAAGGIGIGGALNLVLLGSTVAAESQNSNVTASKALSVTASSEKDIFAVTATAGIGSSIGLAGAVGVIVAGLDVQGDAAGQIAGTVNGAKAQQSANTTTGGIDATVAGTYDNSDVLTTRQNAVTRAFAPGLGEGVTARITGGTVRADTLTVTATANSATSNQTFGVAVGLGAYGAALGLTVLRDTVQATGFGDLQANTIQISASTGDLQNSINTVETPRAAVVRSGVASLAGGNALAGTFATAVVENVVTASLGGVVRSPIRGQGSVAVGAGDASSVVAESYGAAVALLNGVGVSSATALKSSAVSAGLAAMTTTSGSVAPDVGGFDTVAVTAQSAGSVRAFTVAGAGGLGVAGQAAIATARDTATVTAGLDAGAIVAANGLTINALAVPQVSAQAYGVAVGGVGGLGAAVAIAEALPTVRALIGTGADLSRAGAVDLGATAALATDVPLTGNDYFADRRSRYDTTGQSGKESAFAKTGAGSGSLLFGGVVNISRARTAANVQALVGDGVKLPAGLVGVSAISTTSANAWGLGVAAGLVGLGVVSSDADADSTTYARLGDGVTTAGGRKAGLTVNAAGNDSLNATAIAGTVGFIAGNGAIATTGGTSDVQATLGKNDAIAANGVTVAASHTASTINRADTYNAAIVGGSAASAANSFVSNVTAGLGSGTRLDVSGSGIATGVSITAQNTFLRPVGDTASAGGGAGGGLTATAALSETTFSGTAATRLDDGVVINSGSDPVADAGRVSIVASTIVYAVDSVALTTGGVIQGAGVDSRVKADVANTVDIGNAAGGATIGSFGVINVGTYANIFGNANGYVSTSGLAAIGSANARTDLIANQTVTVAAGSNLTGFDNVYVTAGRDTLGGNGTALTGSANAQGYVRGLIAVPDADARVYDTSNTSVSIAGAVRSAQNVVIGGYQGVTSTSAQGTGHGYELGFIPVSRDSTDTGTTATSNVAVSGAVTAGIYNSTRVTIADAAAGQGNFGANREYRVDTSGAPVTIAFDPNFSVASFLNRMADATVRQTLASGTQASAPTFALSQLYAAGGSITINADRYAGNGTLTANGSPTITVGNSSNAYLYLTGGAYIPNTGGGRVIFTGLSAADHPATGGSGAAPSITIANTSSYLYPAAPGADGYGPAILIAGDITNLGGLVQISNRGGSYGSVGSVAAQTFGVDVPNGVFAVSADQFFANAAPQAGFNDSVVYPGGDPRKGMPNATDAINYLASALRPGAGNTDALNEALIGHAWQTEGRNSTVLTKTGNGYACLPFVGGSSGCARGGDNYRISDSDSDGYPGFAKVTWKPLQYASDSYPALDPTIVPRIYGGRVAISANVIDVNASITVGQPTNQSILLSSALTQSTGTQQVFDRFDYQLVNGRMTLMPIFKTIVTGGDIAVARATNAGKVELTSGVSVVNAGDAQIRAYYDTATDQVTLDRVNASTGSAYLYLKGAIINTSSTLGRIVVNGGLGKVDVQNQTGIGLVVNDVNTGNATLAALTPSRVKIWDTLKSGDNTTTYVYNPGNGLLTYLTQNGADPMVGAAAAQVSSGNTATYNPLANARYQWIQEAALGRTITAVDASKGQYLLSDWSFTSANGASVKSGIANDPWLYRAADGSLQASPTGRIVVGSASGHVFEQTITGTTGDTTSIPVHYHGCGDSYCNFAFRKSGDNDPFKGYEGQAYAEWVYSFPLAAQLTLTNSVKADNPIGITFAVNDTASVRVTSNSTVTLAGSITNANGLLTVNATAGDIVQTGAASTLTKGITLNASGAIGSAGQAVTAALTGGSVNASAGKTVNLAFTTDATLDSVSAGSAVAGYADVSVAAAGTVRAGTPGANGANVTGGSITLTSANGGVGAGNAPIVIAANPAATSAAGTLVGGIVTVKATGDLALRQIAGDLRVGQIASSTGNVSVDVANGRIIDAAGQTSASVLTAAQLKQVETSLQLVAPGNGGLTSAQQATVTGFQSLIDRDLAAYRSLTGVGSAAASGTAAPDVGVLAFYRGLAQADAVARARSTGGAVGTLTDADVQAFIAASHAANGTYVVDPAQRAAVVAAYRDRASVTLGLPAGTATDAQVLAYLDAQYQGQIQHFTQAFGTDWKVDVARQTTPFVADAALVTALTKDQVWDPKQLVSFVDRSSLQPAPVTIGSTSTADIVGARVSLAARDGIGRLAAPVSISLADLQNGNLTPEQVAALAVSSNPGSVTLVGTRNGQVVSGFDINSVPADVTLSGVVIGETAPVFVSAADLIDASSAGSIFLQGTANPQSAGSTLRIGAVTAGGDVKLLAPDSLVGLSGGVNVTAKGNIDLAAGSAIGSAATPFTIADGTLRLVSAGTNAYVAAPTGRLDVGRASAGGVLSLAAKDDIVGALSGISASAGTILLAAGGDIGAQGSPFQVQTLAGGQLSGSAGGSAYLTAPLVADRNPTDFTIGTLTAGTDLVLGSGTGLVIRDSATAMAGRLTVDAVSLAMNAGSRLNAGQGIALRTTGAAILGHVATTGRTTAADTIAVLADTIAGNGDGQINLATVGPDAGVTFTARNGVGTVALPLVLRTARLNGSTVTGDLRIAARDGLRATSLSAGGGIVVTGTGDLALDAVTSGLGLSAQAGGALGVGTARSGTDMRLGAVGDLRFTALTAGGGATLDAGGGVSGGDLTAKGAVRLAAGLGTTGNTLSAGTDATLAAGSDITWSGVTAGGAVTGTSKGTLTLTTAQSGTDTTLSALGDLVFQTLVSGGAGSLDAGGAVRGSSLKAAGSVLLTAVGGTSGDTLNAGTDARLKAGSDITWSGMTAGRALIAQAGGGLGIGSARSGADTTLSALGDLVFQTLESGGAGSLDAGGAVRGGALTAAGSVLLTAVGGISGDTLNAGMNASLTAGSDVAWSAIRAGDALAVQTKGSVAVASAQSGSDTTIAALGGIRFDQLTAGRSASLDAGQGIQGGVLSAFFGAGLKAGSDIAWNSITTGGGLWAQAGRTLTFDTARSGGDTTLASTGDLVFRTLDTGSKAGLNGGGAVRGTTLTAGGSIALTAGGETRGDTLTATDAAGLKAGSNLAWRQITTGRGADLTLDAGGDIDSALLKSGGNLAVTSGGNLQAKMAQVLGSAQLTTAGTSIGEAIYVATGDLALTSGGTLTWDVLQAASGTLAIEVTGGAARLGVTGTSGAQTIRTAGDLSFSDLTSGATIDAMVGGSLAGTSMTAGGTIRLVAAGDNRGERMTSRGGDVALTAGGTLDWGLANGAGGFTATSTGGAVRLGSIYSGGAQTIAAAGDVGLAVLGAGGDLTIDSGATITGGSIETNGSARLLAIRDNTGDKLLARTGLIDLQGGGLVRWNGLNAAGRLSVVSTDGAVAVQRATSGAEMVLAALRDVGFGTLKAGGNLDLRSLSGAVRGGDAAAGGTLTASGTPIVFNTLAGDTGLVLRSAGDVTGNAVRGNGDITVDAAGTITLNGLDGAGIALSTPGGLKLSTLVAHRAVTLAARTIDVGLLRQAADYAGPLNLTVTGYGGTTGDSARLTVDAAQTLLPTLNQAVAQFTTTGGDFAVGAGTITGRFSLATPLAFLQMDNRDPTPRVGNSVQLFQPSYTFTLDQRGYTTTTTAFVVGYDTTMAIRDVLDGQIYLGASFVRDFDRTNAMSRATSGVFRDATIVPGLGSPGPIPVQVQDPGQPGVNLGTDPEQFGDAIEDGRIVPARQDRSTGQADRPQ